MPLTTARAVRTARLASLPLAAAGLAVQGLVRRRLLGQDPDAVMRDLRRRNAERTRRVLGELKGGALKAGQLLSTVEALFPTDPEATWRAALTATQEGAVPLPWPEVRAVLEAELGDWRAVLPELDERPVAAASLGQVHRGRDAEGRDVAVKVQYPGVREALVADVRTVSAMTRLVGVVARGLALPPLVAELRERLAEELDYCREAAVQQAFADAYEGSTEVAVPHVRHATSRVLVSDWLAGTPLAAVAETADQATRDLLGHRYQVFLVSGPERAGWLHTDPHPGNFRLTPDGRLGALDFGSALRLPGAMPSTFGRLLRVLVARDPDEVVTGLDEEGFLRPGARLDVRALTDYLAPFSEPARHEDFTFTRDWLRGEFGRLNDPRSPDFAVALQLTVPAEHLFTHRVWLGMVGVLCQLEATVPVRPVLERWLPGFAAAPRAVP